MSKLFSTEVMVCQNCGKKQRADPHIESQWNHIEVDGIGFYLCPQCWNDGKPTQTFLEWLASKFPRNID
jgi:hypothetical protein